MYELKDIKVTLLNPDEVKNFIQNHGRIACVCYDTDEKYVYRVGYSCLKEGHTSGSRGDYFKFEIECPRFTADQIMRHEQGVFKNCQSQRYVDMDNFDLYIPPRAANDPQLRRLYEEYEFNARQWYQLTRFEMEARGITGEKANDLMRTMLPIGVKTKLRIGFDIEALIHFMHKRLCVRADEPIRQVARLMRDAVLEVTPRYEEFLVPQCVDLLYCPEKHGCAAYPNKKEIEELIELGIKVKANEEKFIDIDDNWEGDKE